MNNPMYFLERFALSYYHPHYFSPTSTRIYKTEAIKIIHINTLFISLLRPTNPGNICDVNVATDLIYTYYKKKESRLIFVLGGKSDI